MAYEQTCALIKPHIVEKADAIEICAAIMERYTVEGLAILGVRCFRMTRIFIVEFYADHIDKPFFERDIVPAMTIGRTIALKLGAGGAIQKVREINGKTDPKDAAPGTIRAMYGIETKFNAVHSSDSLASAERELKLVFP